MVQRLEVFGEPGSGKTRLLGAALKAGGSPGFLSPDEALIRYYFESRRGGLPKALFRLGVPPAWMGSAGQKRRSAVQRARRELMARASPAFIEGARAFYAALADIQERQTELLAVANSFDRSVAAALVAEALPGDRIVLHDEGLLQRGLSLSVRGVPDAAVSAFYRAMPLPRAVVWISVPREERLRRLQGRGEAQQRTGLAEQYRRTDAASSEGIALGCQCLRERGVPLLEIDGLLSPEEQVRTLQAGIRRLGSPGKGA